MRGIGLESLTVLILSCVLWKDATGLECYACNYQDGNKDKCVKTSKQCEEHEDICVTTIRWALPPYWTPYGERMHFVTKDCDTSENCEKRKQDMMKHCKRDWFDDWSCIECCNGDLCNYYVTLGSGNTMPSLLLTALTSMTAIVVLRTQW